MQTDSHLKRAAWTLADQAIVSIGAFLVNILLARALPPAEYGVFALLFSAMLALQIVNGSLLFYPLSVRLAIVSAAERTQLIILSVVLSVVLSLILAAALCIGIALFGRTDLILPATAWFFMWQIQETTRRILFSEFRHRAAVWGDSISYIGRLAIVLPLLFLQEGTLGSVFYAMAIASALAAALQAYQCRLSAVRTRMSLSGLTRVAKDFFSIGGWSLGNNMVSLLRIQSLPWALAAAYGPAAAASFQAALNVVNLANPITLGLGNVIPQAAAQGRLQGDRSAWTASRAYVLVGVPPLFLYYAAAFLVPAAILSTFYGAGSPYTDLTEAVQILAVAWAVAYAADMICSFLHGVDAAKSAFAINVAGAATAFVIGIPLVLTWGLVGGCVALALSNLVRTGFAFLTLTRMVTNERPSLA